MLLKRRQRVTNMETASPTHTTWATPQALTHCGTGNDGNLWDCTNALVALLRSTASSSCRCGESQQRWNQWLWFAIWSWASSPAGSVWLHRGFHRCCLRAGPRGTALTEHILRSQSTETTVLKPDSYKKTCKLGDTDLSGFLLVLEGWTSPDLHGWVATPLH